MALFCLFAAIQRHALKIFRKTLLKVVTCIGECIPEIREKFNSRATAALSHQEESYRDKANKYYAQGLKVKKGKVIPLI